MFLGRFGFFLASDSAFKPIYGHGTVFGGELRLGGRRITGWLEGNYRARTGFTLEDFFSSYLASELITQRIPPRNNMPAFWIFSSDSR